MAATTQDRIREHLNGDKAGPDDGNIIADTNINDVPGTDGSIRREVVGEENDKKELMEDDSAGTDCDIPGTDGSISREVVGEENDKKGLMEDDNETHLNRSMDSDREVTEAEHGGPEGQTRSWEGNISNGQHQNDGDETVQDANTKDDEELSSQMDKLLDFGSNPEDMDPEDRSQLYELGQALQNRGKNVHALKCFLRCLSGLNGKRNFSNMSECLRKVAEIYYTMEEYEKAVQFIQAEKVYYESALVDSPETQEQLLTTADGSKSSDEVTDGSPNSSPDDYNNTDVIRAQEYDSLAQLCLEHKQAEMALEYQGKATKLRQKLLGNDHPVTMKSLDQFTVMYGEAGKHQYAESMSKLQKSHVDDTNTGAETSGLRQRKGRPSANKEKAEKADINHAETEPEEQDDVFTQRLLVALFLICLVALIGAGCYLYCRIVVGSQTCASWKTMIEYRLNRLYYWFTILVMPGLPADT